MRDLNSLEECAIRHEAIQRFTATIPELAGHDWTGDSGLEGQPIQEIVVQTGQHDEDAFLHLCILVAFEAGRMYEREAIP